MKIMRIATLLLILGSALTVGAQAPGQDPATKESAKLEGIWAIVSVEIEGNSLAMDKLKESRLTVHGKEYSFKLGDTHLEFTYRLNASGFPNAIDLIVAAGPEKGKVYYGICKLEKDRYEICRTTVPGKARPTAFVTRPNSGLMIVVWHREKLGN
jgi:uncharacterized protein (TIGR03067 family)